MKYPFLFSIILLLVASCSGSKTITLKTPVFDKHYIDAKYQKKLKTGSYESSVTLKKLEEQTDDLDYVESCNAWFEDYGIQLNAMSYNDGVMLRPFKNLGVKTPWIKNYRTHQLGEKTYHLSHVHEQEQVALFFYGAAPNKFNVVLDLSVLVVRNKNNQQIIGCYDFQNFTYAPEFIEEDKNYIFQDIVWAHEESDVLYVAHRHSTYSESSKGMNGYITAIHLKSGKILWRSQPKVMNALNFILMDNTIFACYGFTNEGAHLYAIDKYSGQVKGMLELEKAGLQNNYIVLIGQDAGKIYIKASENKAYTISYQ